MQSSRARQTEPLRAAIRLLIFWKDASVFNAGSWGIGNDFTNFKVLWPSYKWRLHCYGVYTSDILPLLVRNRDLREMQRRGLIVFTEDPPEDYGSVLLDLCLWELCFSLVSPLWELCYSLASC